MENIELLEHMVRMQAEQKMQAETIQTMTKTLELACARIIALENCVITMNSHLASATSTMAMQASVVEELGKIAGNNTLPRNKEKCKGPRLSLVAREIARDNV